MVEEWRKVPGYENYEVSNTGKVVNNNFNRKGVRKEMTYKNNRGYLAVSLFRNGNGKDITVHRLVAQEFIPNPNNLREVNHIDGNKENNNVDNLEWCTREENLEHAKNSGLAYKRSRSIVAVFPDGSEIEYESTEDAVRKTGISQPSIWRSLKGLCKNSKGIIFKYKE